MNKPDDKIIYLIPGEYDGTNGYLWSQDPAPGEHDDPSEAIKFIRFDLHEKEVKQLQGNHNGLKERMRLLHQRHDMPVERIEAFKLVENLQNELAETKSQLVAIQDSVVHGKCANAEPCSTFCEAIATRKMMRQLQAENAALRGSIAGAESKAKEELIPPFLLELSKQLNEQPSRCTSHPFYQVRCKRKYVTAEDYSSDLFEIVGPEGVEWSEGQDNEDLAEHLAEHYPDWIREQFEDYVDEDSDLEQIVLEHFEFDCSELPDGLRKVWMQEIDEVVSTHLTLEAAEQFIKRKQHDYPKLFTYAESAYWSPQLRELQEWIKSLTHKAVSDENN